MSGRTARREPPAPATARRERRIGKTTGRFGLRAGEPHRHLAAALPDPPLDRAERRQRRGPRQPPAGRGLVPANGFGEISARIGRAPQGLPTGKEDRGVEPVPRNRLRVDEEARGALGGGLIPEDCHLGTIFEAKYVAGSGCRGHGRLQSGIGEIRCGRAWIAPTCLSEATRLSLNPSRPSSRRPTGGASGKAGEPSRRSVATRVLTALSCGPAR